MALKRAGALLHVDGKLDEAERLYREALALDEALVARYPDNATYRYDMTFSLSDLALTARKRGDPAAATALYLRALEIREAALDADPKNVRAMLGVANLHSYLGTCAAELKQFDEQVTHRREALRLIEAVIAVREPQAEDISRRTWWQIYLAQALMDLAEAPSGGEPAGAVRRSVQRASTGRALGPRRGRAARGRPGIIGVVRRAARAAPAPPVGPRPSARRPPRRGRACS